ncbi:unnamed protein product [Candidula unifasciata]|uniref:Carbonic anhydrase n=1 Tax=Candidula unifasciata TaxID=100452 RepID=A0A8S3YWU0_9EUPU|nr:unnamed protein product [Candidula unifasciata]
MCPVQCGCGFVVLTALICLLVSGADSQERAYRTAGGSLLCPLVEDFYSYKRSTSYGPSRWGEISECCQGQRQSPRDLASSSGSLCGGGQHHMFSYNSSRALPGKLYNNGHDPTISFHGSNTAYLFNAPHTNGAYILDNIHIHFCTNAKGSEHAIDGQFYQGEIHLVHYKASYGTLAKAVQQEDGLVVVGIMLQSRAGYAGDMNQELVKIIQRMGNLEGTGKEYQLPVQLNVARIFPKSTNFYTYEGSMTSPPCSESVRWIIFREPVNVSSAEMDILRRLPNEDRSSTVQSCNDRPLQTGHTRVETNFACSSVTNMAAEEI